MLGIDACNKQKKKADEPNVIKRLINVKRTFDTYKKNKCKLQVKFASHKKYHFSQHKNIPNISSQHIDGQLARCAEISSMNCRHNVDISIKISQKVFKYGKHITTYTISPMHSFKNAS